MEGGEGSAGKSRQFKTDVTPLTFVLHTLDPLCLLRHLHKLLHNMWTTYCHAPSSLMPGCSLSLIQCLNCMNITDTHSVQSLFAPHAKKNNLTNQKKNYTYCGKLSNLKYLRAKGCEAIHSITVAITSTYIFSNNLSDKHCISAALTLP